MSEENKEKFIVKKITRLDELEEGDIIDTSDLALQWTGVESGIPYLTQCEFIKNKENKKKLIIKPGCFSFEETNSGIILDKIELRKRDLLQSVLNTNIIKREVEQFFGNLDMYEKLNETKKRGILLYSIPGVGKTATINEVCNEYLKQEGTLVVNWDTSKIRASKINDFYISNSMFHEDVKRQFLIIEDVGGASVDNYSGGVKAGDSALLNLLDGMSDPFKGVPTLILVTTNNPETQVGALIDRPGRFDSVIQLHPPKFEEIVDILKFKKQKLFPNDFELSEEELEASKLAEKHKFSIAHLEEIVKRSVLTNKSYLTIVQDMVKHKKKISNRFEDEQDYSGFGL